MRLFGEIFKQDWCTAFLARKFLPYQKKKYVMNWAFNVCLFSRPLQRMRWWVGSCRIEWMHLLSISKLEECPLYSRFPSIPYKWAFPTHGFANLVDGTPAGRISWAKKTPHLSLVNIISNRKKCLYCTISKNKIQNVIFKYGFWKEMEIGVSSVASIPSSSCEPEKPNQYPIFCKSFIFKLFFTFLMFLIQ